MAKYNVLKGFRADDKDGVKCPTRQKGTVVELSGDELKFAKSKKCVSAVGDE